MNNGQHGAILGNTEQYNNINQDDWQRSLEISAPVDIPSPDQIIPKDQLSDRSEDESLVQLPEQRPSEQQPPKDIDQPTDLAPKLGQITPLSPIMPPIEPSNNTKPYNPTRIKTTGDYLDKNSIVEIEKLEDKLSQDGDLNAFYEDTRDLTAVNLDNSFNRKLYHQDSQDEQGGQNIQNIQNAQGGGR